MGEAFRLARLEMESEGARLLALRCRLWDGLQELGGIVLNGHGERCLPGLLNLSVAGVEGEALIMALKDLAVSAGSACAAANLEPSHVLRAIGREDRLARSTIRFSLGRFTTEEEVDHAIAQVGHPGSSIAGARVALMRPSGRMVPAHPLPSQSSGPSISPPVGRCRAAASRSWL